MPENQANGYIGSLQIQIKRSQDNANLAWIFASFACLVAFIALLVALARTPPQPDTELAKLEKKLEQARIEIDQIRSRANAGVAPSKELRVSSLIVENGSESVTILPSGIGLSRMNGAAMEIGWSVSQERGRTSMKLSNMGQSGAITMDSHGPSITLTDNLGKDRAVLGVTYTVKVKDGEQTTTSPANMTFFDLDGKVTLSLPFRQ